LRTVGAEAMNPSPRTRDDFKRITRAYRLLREFMRDGQRHTIPEMAAAAECSENAVSARWRELQYPCSLDGFAGYEQHKDRLPNGAYIYWVTLRAVEQLDLAI
jgi:hypothetical protein